MIVFRLHLFISRKTSFNQSNDNNSSIQLCIPFINAQKNFSVFFFYLAANCLIQLICTLLLSSFDSFKFSFKINFEHSNTEWIDLYCNWICLMTLGRNHVHAQPKTEPKEKHSNHTIFVKSFYYHVSFWFCFFLVHQYNRLCQTRSLNQFALSTLFFPSNLYLSTYYYISSYLFSFHIVILLLQMFSLCVWWPNLISFRV